MSIKTRCIPSKEFPLAYQTYLNTVGSEKAAQELMRELEKELERGLNYFCCLRVIDHYSKILGQVSKMNDKKIMADIARRYLSICREKINNQTTTKVIKSFSSNVIVTAHKKFTKEIKGYRPYPSIQRFRKA